MDVLFRVSKNENKKPFTPIIKLGRVRIFNHQFQTSSFLVEKGLRRDIRKQ